MNQSITHLPEKAQSELTELIDYIRQEVPETQFIILYGSYARGEQVVYDQRVEFGLRTSFMSDYDIVVLTPKKRASYNSVMRRLENANKKFASGLKLFIKPTVEFITMPTEEFNDEIAQGLYFYTDIRKEGIILFDNGEATLEEVRPLNLEQIYKLSQRYFEEKYSKADKFLKHAKIDYNDSDYVMASFMLHQATENYLLSIVLTASLHSPKDHNVIKILDKTKLFTDIAAKVFLVPNEEDKRLLDLLQKAYVQARYNKDFVVTKEDIDALLVKIEMLRTETKQFCTEQIEKHKQALAKQ